jgi:6-phosphogluconolactonase
MMSSKTGMSYLAAVVAMVLCLQMPRAEAQSKSDKDYLIYIGTYGTKTKGIYAYRTDGNMENPKSLGLVAETTNPFVLAASPNHHVLYATNMGHSYNGQVSGSVSAFAIDDQTGRLNAIDQVASHGADPAYVSLDKTGKFALVANYTSGNVAVFSLRPDGGLGDMVSSDQHTGTGADPKRQAGPRPHSISVSTDNRFVLSADLGLDKIFVYRFNSETGAITHAPEDDARTTPGVGPRHFVFSRNGNYVYVADEMGSTITGFAYDAATGSLRKLEEISTRPKGATIENTDAEIQIANSGKFIYASNRGDDTIAVFAVNEKSGALTPIEYEPAGGKIPGMIALDPSGSYLLSANKGSDNVTIFRVHQSTGKLTPIGQPLDAPDPAYVLILPITK